MTFYDHDADLVALLAGYVGDGLDRDEAVVVVTTPAHRAALEQALAQRGLRVDELPARYVVLDAAETLRALCPGGVPDRDAFARSVGAAVDRLAGRPVRLFGEVVSLLWEAGDPGAALAVESLWEEAAHARDLLLLCAYPTAALSDGAGLDVLSRVCGHHRVLLAPPSYRSGVVVAGRPAGGGRTEAFVPVPESIGTVRRFVGWTLRAWCCDALAPDVELVASELATNAVEHGGGPYEVSVSRRDGVVRLAVADRGRGRPLVVSPSTHRESGRGIAIVQTLADRWGVDDAGGGKVVWAEFDASAPAA